MEYDQLLTTLGQFGLYQKLIYFMVGIIGIPCAMYNLGYMFWAASPDFWCSVPDLSSLTNLTHEEKIRLTLPRITTKGKIAPDPCKVYLRNYSSMTYSTARDLLALNVSDNTPSATCTSWEYDQSQYQSTIVTQWNLVCDDHWLIPTSQSVYMAGKLVGVAMFGYLADRFGRRKIMVLAIGMMVASSIGITFSPNYYFFLVLRFILSTMATAAFQTGFVLGMEVVGPDYRVAAGMLIMVFWAVGYMLVSGLAFAIRNHFQLQLAISVPWVILVSYFWLLPESPRWLIVNGHVKAAKKMIQRIAKVNKVKYTDDLEVTVKKEARTEKNMVDLLRTVQMRRKTLILFYAWFANSFVYYSVTLNSSNLGSNDYLNNMVSGLVELPAYLLSVVAMTKLGRRWPLSGCMILAGLSLLATIPIPSGNQVAVLVVANIGKMAISASYGMIYVYTAELMPTVVRMVGVGSCSFFSRIAGIIAAFSTELDYVYKGLPLLLCGAIALSSGLLVSMLPETKGLHLPETMADGEKTRVTPLSCPRCSKQKTTDKQNGHVTNTTNGHVTFELTKKSTVGTEATDALLEKPAWSSHVMNGSSKINKDEQTERWLQNSQGPNPA